MSTCMTCRHWMRDVTEPAHTSGPRRLCVYLTGLNDFDVAKLRGDIRGAIWTHPEFGCTEHEAKKQEDAA